MVSTSSLAPMFRCSACAVRALGICKSMNTQAELRDLGAARSAFRTISSGEEIYAQGELVDDFFVVLSGWLFLYQVLEDGRRQILRVLMPGDSFGSISSSMREADHSAQALVSTTVCILRKSRIAELRQRFPRYEDEIVEAIERNAHDGMDMVTNLGRCSGSERVVRFLTDCLQRMHRNDLAAADTLEADLPISQIVIGDALGLTPIHVNRILRSLREMHVLSFARGHLKILDVEKLNRLLHGQDTPAPDGGWKAVRPAATGFTRREKPDASQAALALGGEEGRLRVSSSRF